MKSVRKCTARIVRRLIQTACIAIFLWLLWQTAWPLAETLLPVDFFMRLDPLAAVAIPVGARQWIGILMPGLIVLLSALVIGRVFCGYICPMGTTLDIVRNAMNALTGEKKKHGQAKARSTDPKPWLRQCKYLLLFGILGGAILGVNLAFWASPISLITRFYSLLLHPLLLLVGNEGLTLGQRFIVDWSLPGFEYMHIAVRRYETIYFVAAFFVALFWLERVRPRFWCSYLCPAGAVLALCSLRPFWRLKIHTHACDGCGQCVRNCPTGAITDAALPTMGAVAHHECITCRTCTDVCHRQSAKFSLLTPFSSKSATGPEFPDRSSTVFTCELPSRRAFLAAAAGGAALAAVQFSTTGTMLVAADRGILWPSGYIRPPGAVPEPDFLDKCIRCGLCMKACPTNGLQPAGFGSGFFGGQDVVFSPLLVSRRGSCDPACNACGMVCPTGAIQRLPLAEKQWAKIGTAVVQPGLCLAWAEGKRCVVCEEVCPYGAIESVQTVGTSVAVPFVKASRCFGCGYCEQFCPVRVPAIVVHPSNALRLTSTSYRQAGESAGLTLRLTGSGPSYNEQPAELPEGALPPGFLE